MRVPAAILSLLFLTCCASTIPPSPALDIKSSRIEEHIGVPVPIAITIHNVGGAPISNWSAGISLQLITPVCYITGSLHQYERLPWGHDVTPTIVAGQTATTQATVTMSSDVLDAGGILEVRASWHDRHSTVTSRILTVRALPADTEQLQQMRRNLMACASAWVGGCSGAVDYFRQVRDPEAAEQLAALVPTHTYDADLLRAVFSQHRDTDVAILEAALTAPNVDAKLVKDLERRLSRHEYCISADTSRVQP